MTSATTVPSHAAAPRRALHQPFSWTPGARDLDASSTNAAGYAELAGLSRDVAAGVGAILGLLERREIDASCEDESGAPLRPLLDSEATGSLMRLCIASCAMLRDDAERRCDEVNQAGGGR